MKQPNARPATYVAGLPGSDPVLLAIIPVLGAVLACLYDAGYLLSFGVPLEYVDVTLPRMLVATSLVVLYSLLIYLMTGTELRVALHRHVPRMKAIIGGGVIVLAVAAYFHFALRSSNYDLSPYLGAIWALVGIVAYGYGEKLLFVLAALQRLTSSGPDGSTYDADFETSRSRATKRLAANAAGFVVFASIFAVLMGFSIGQTKRDFLAMQGAENFLLVRQSRDVMIFARHEEGKSRLTSQLRFVRVDRTGKPLDLVQVDLAANRPLAY